MYTLYVLKSIHFDKMYIGVTSNIEARIAAHNHPKNKGWTKSFMPWTVVYTEEFDSKTEALKREKQLKSYQGRQFLKNEILNKPG